MLTGIVAAVLCIFTCLRAVDKRILKKPGVFTKIHAPASIAFVAATLAHIALTVPLFASRPVLAVAAGFVLAVFMLAACAAAMKKKYGLHKIAAWFAVFMLALHVAANLAGVAAYQNKVNGTVIDYIDFMIMPDGTYTGEYDVTFIYVKVEVTVTDNAITDITILKHRNERGKPAERIPDTIIAQQAIDVDAVAGATNSSTVIKKAVENALQTAMEPSY